MALSQVLLERIANPQITDYTQRFATQRAENRKAEAENLAIQDARRKLTLAQYLDPLAVSRAELENEQVAAQTGLYGAQTGLAQEQSARMALLAPLEADAQRAQTGLYGAQANEYTLKREQAAKFSESMRKFLSGDDKALAELPPQQALEAVKARKELKEDPEKAKEAGRAASAAAGVLAAPEEQRPALYRRWLDRYGDEEDVAAAPDEYGDDAEIALQVFSDSFRDVDAIAKAAEKGGAGTASVEEKYRQMETGKQVARLKTQYKAAAIGSQSFLRKLGRARKITMSLDKTGGFGPIDANGKLQTTGRILNTKEQALRDEFTALMSDLELDVARMKLKGQGQVTEGEREIVRRSIPSASLQNGNVALNILQSLEAEAYENIETEKSISSFKGTPSEFLDQFSNTEGGDISVSGTKNSDVKQPKYVVDY